MFLTAFSTRVSVLSSEIHNGMALLKIVKGIFRDKKESWVKRKKKKKKERKY